MEIELWRAMQTFWDAKAAEPGAITPGDQWQIAVGDANEILHEFDGAGATLVEVGCGEGRLAGPLSAKVARYIGVDISSVALSRAPCETIWIADPSEFRNALRGIDVDIVCSWTVFSHLPPPVLEWWLGECFAVLRPGGTLRARFEHTERTLEHRFDRVPPNEFWEGRWYPDYMVASMLERAGFRVTGLPFEYISVWRTLECSRVWRAEKPRNDNG